MRHPLRDAKCPPSAYGANEEDEMRLSVPLLMPLAIGLLLAGGTGRARAQDDPPAPVRAGLPPLDRELSTVPGVSIVCVAESFRDLADRHPRREDGADEDNNSDRRADEEQNTVRRV